MREKSLGGAIYFATFIDDKSRYTKTYFLKGKDEVKSAFLNYKAKVEKMHNCKIKILRTDGGLEYMGKEFAEILENEGIQRHTVAYIPQQNGVAGRMNRTLVEVARCLLIHAKLPKYFWAEAINTAAYLRNRSRTSSLRNSTQYEKFFNSKPNISHLRVFGCKAFASNKISTKGKFNPRSIECIFLGYDNESKAYRLFNTESRKIIKSRDVKFLDEFQEDIPLSDNTIKFNILKSKTQDSSQKEEENEKKEEYEEEEKENEAEGEEDVYSGNDEKPNTRLKLK